jgi:ribonuclease BN (tRNA processing enzyme)
MKSVQILFLGAGDAFSAGGRHQAGYLVSGDGTSILLDCGATTLASLKRESVPTGSIDAIFLSHLHGDHFSGLPFLFLEYTYAEPRRRPLRIAGPPGTADRVHELFRAMYRDAGSRPLPFEVDFVELKPGAQSRTGSIVVDPFRVPHQQAELSLGFMVTLNGRRIAYSGDTGWTEDLISRSEGTDLFICECSFFQTKVDSHIDYPRIAENRHRFGTKRLILTHLGAEVLARRDEVDIELACDGLRIEL